MDKQITGLSGSQNHDFFELLNTQEDQNGEKKDEIFPSYDFQPIRPVVGSSGSAGNLEGGGSRAWTSADSKRNSSGFRPTYTSLEPHESAKFTLENDKSAHDAAIIAEIDRTMKKHADNLFHALEAVSARLSQLETRTHCLEDSVDDLKVSLGNNNGSTDGKLRQLENVLREVQTSVQVLRDKHEIAEAQLQLAKLQASSKGDLQGENPNTMQADSLQQPTSLPLQSLPPPQSLQSLPPPQSLQSLPPPAALQQPSPLPVLAPNAPPPPPPVHVPTQLSSSQMPPIPSLAREQYYPPQSQPPEPTHQQYQMPAQQPPPAQQHYQAPTQVSPYTQPGQLPQQHQPHGSINPPQLQPPLSHHPEENACNPPPATYPSSIRPPPSLTQPPIGSAPPQQFYGPNAHLYEPSGSRPSSGQLPIPAGYGPPAGPNFNDSYPYSGSPSHYSSSSMKPPQHSSASAPTSGSSYSRLPTVQVLPHALPTATSIGSGSGSGSGSGGTGNRVPIDDVVDKVATMGFSREQVRATVRKLTENGQSVDLNVVLDKLMNDGEIIQPQKSWFGR
ncbi:hypothetical protein MRB53_031617 [Persea americana]|uniref:Uncharacterized protein n=1 Tax=Persea americana TaxID=3435 RepID=A0ACC2KPV5_PERAE|nr:hypothetical protein MRB53_031617 [Persea americana]